MSDKPQNNENQEQEKDEKKQKEGHIKIQIGEKEKEKDEKEKEKDEKEKQKQEEEKKKKEEEEKKKKEEEEKKKPKFIENVDFSSFDLDGYISNYVGHTRIHRLIYIAEHSRVHHMEALRMVLHEIKNTLNTQLYMDLMSRFQEELSGTVPFDQDWVDDTLAKATQEYDTLDTQLKLGKQNLIKGYFLQEIGFTKPEHIIDMCLNVILASIEMKSYGHVISYVKATQNKTTMKLEAISGLAKLDSKDFRTAATKFLHISTHIPFDYPEVISPQDIAIYGTLCALATFRRSEIFEKVLQNESFKNFLEYVPEVKQLANDFYYSRYLSFVNILDSLKPQLLLDLHLGHHVEKLYSQIRSKALLQYFSPFVSLNMKTMAKDFATDIDSLEKEISLLIAEDEMKAKIDSHNKILHSCKVDIRSQTFKDALGKGETYYRKTKSLLLRANLLRQNMTVRVKKQKNARNANIAHQMLAMFGRRF
ncbi:cop9 signalosome complex subunit 1 [Anaeramoeba ignava]|uniref:Cop9 signalosome complex subunit 1 n=1 Tax=Anaeramoeba ignava TaxID=1746090 RepID=A0A9Q0LEK6_ANAIG|nr:cop9 signalosome complex subunit 1 [Anaeramoeba ignava]